MKGIILAGGKGTRLYPLTKGISKQLLPVYKQPMIYYPLKTLVDMGIKDILIIVASVLQSTLFKLYLGEGDDYGVRIQYKIQNEPKGLAEAFILGEEFIGEDDVTLILGDNVFLTPYPIDPTPNTIFTYKVKNPKAYGVVTVDDSGYILDLVEKPQTFISHDAVVGLYVFTNKVVEIAKQVTPSFERGELEIVDVIKLMHAAEGVVAAPMDGVWFDCGTHDDLLECAEFIRALDKRTFRDIMLKEL